MSLRILHTSDWHLGRQLYGRSRYAEFNAFLAWLKQTIQQQKIDVLLVAGDIFDASTPSHQAQTQYYQFLHDVARSCCRHIVIIAGNHDSPSFLNAPKTLLKAFNIHVVAQGSQNPDDDVLVLYDAQNRPELIVCAVPYLRDKDLRTAQAGESLQDKERKLIEGLQAYYATVGQFAQQKRTELGVSIPIIGMGHLFTAGGQTQEDDGVRELYIGSIAHVGAHIFSNYFDYVALGHLHIPQKVNNNETIRYSGSPIAIGFGEAKQQKSVCLLEFHSENLAIELISVPVFQALSRIQGDWAGIESHIVQLKKHSYPVWLEVIYDGKEIVNDLRERLEALTADSAIEILKVKNTRLIQYVLKPAHQEETLDDLSLDEVFRRCLYAHDIPDNQHEALFSTYREAVALFYDKNG